MSARQESHDETGQYPFETERQHNKHIIQLYLGKMREEERREDTDILQRTAPPEVHCPKKREKERNQIATTEIRLEYNINNTIRYDTTQHNTAQHNTTQHNTRQDKTKQDKTRQDKTRQDKARQGKARQDKTRQDKTRQYKSLYLYTIIFKISNYSDVLL